MSTILVGIRHAPPWRGFCVKERKVFARVRVSALNLLSFTSRFYVISMLFVLSFVFLVLPAMYKDTDVEVSKELRRNFRTKQVVTNPST
jgi:hypothetical protein